MNDILLQEKILAKILLVDDRPENLYALEKILQKLDCEVYKAYSGNEALSLSIRHDFALILLDVNMPDMDGFEVADLLRGNDTTAHVPIIFVTAISKEEKYVFRGYEAGAVDYLMKPVDTDILISKVRVFLELDLKRKELEAVKAKLEEHVIRLQEASDTDGLTLIANRRCFDRTLDKEFQRLKRHIDEASDRKCLSLILLDVDYFKKYNDCYGHLEGDHCLREVAKALSRAVYRPGDLVARYGGEEFVVLLPMTPLSDAVQVAERIRLEVEQLNLLHATSDVSPVVTVSLGVASLEPTEGNDADMLIRQADQALYQAKMAGRNRVCGTE